MKTRTLIVAATVLFAASTLISSVSADTFLPIEVAGNPQKFMGTVAIHFKMAAEAPRH